MAWCHLPGTDFPSAQATEAWIWASCSPNPDTTPAHLSNGRHIPEPFSSPPSARDISPRPRSGMTSAASMRGNRMKRDLKIRALKMAIALRSPPRGCIFHSDRGSQYCSHDYQKILREHGFKASMSGKGNCYDNAAILRRENSPLDCSLIRLTFFKTIKAEMILKKVVGNKTASRNRHLPIHQRLL